MLARVKLVTEVDRAVLDALRQIARSEGRPLRALVDEAFADLLAKRRQGGPKPDVMAAYRTSHDRFSSLYERLAG